MSWKVKVALAVSPGRPGRTASAGRYQENSSTGHSGRGEKKHNGGEGVRGAPLLTRIKMRCYP
eukprot:COSAG02_NODE_706_length_18259_cov_10.340253_8_plen_63_part_00